MEIDYLCPVVYKSFTEFHLFIADLHLLSLCILRCTIEYYLMKTGEYLHQVYRLVLPLRFKELHVKTGHALFKIHTTAELKGVSKLNEKLRKNEQ